MKKITLITLSLAIGASVYAQPPHPKIDHTQLPKPLLVQLKLTAEQQTKVTAILKSTNVEIDSLVKKSHVGRNRVAGAKIKSAATEADDQLYAVFTKDQQLVYAQWILDRRAKMAKMKKPGPPPAM